eukprot:COSAG01_NODE_7558_length_3150_cov_3.446411_5_plen_58_part_00
MSRLRYYICKLRRSDRQFALDGLQCQMSVDVLHGIHLESFPPLLVVLVKAPSAGSRG